MTFSVGFRAPALADLAASYLAHVVETTDADAHYEDPGLRPQREPGQIDDRVLDRIAELLGGVLGDRKRLGEWFGSFVSEPRRELCELPLEEPIEPTELIQALQDGATLWRSAISRFCFLERGTEGPLLFVGGKPYSLTRPLAFAAPLLCGERRLDARALSPHLNDGSFMRIVTDLVNRGFLIVE